MPAGNVTIGLPILDPSQLVLRVTKRNGSFADLSQGAVNYRATKRDGSFLPFSFATVRGIVRVTKRNGAFYEVYPPFEIDPGGGIGHVHSFSQQTCSVCGQVVATCACGYRSCGH